jgi:putative ABC transport system permease protein
MLSKEFVKWVLLATLIAWPVAYFILKSWLQNFAYHADLNVMTFLLAAVLAFVLALLTVTYQSIKAAMADPVVSLRYE